MNEFKVGDKVRCIQPGGSSVYAIELNKVYTISEIGKGMYINLIFLKEAPHNTSWFSKRFELVKDDKKDEILMPRDNKPKTSGWGF